MFSFTCPLCSRKFLTVEKRPCFYCIGPSDMCIAKDESFRQRQAHVSNSKDTNAVGGSENLQDPRDTDVIGESENLQVPRDTDVIGESENLQVPRDTDVVGDTENLQVLRDMKTSRNIQLKINKKIKLNDSRMTEGSIAHKRCTQEIGSERAEALSSYNKVGRDIRNFVPETSAAEVQLSSDNNQTVDIHPKLLTITHNQNITLNISIPRSSLENDQPIKYPEAEAFKIKSVSSSDDHLAIPGPSGLQKMCEEKLHSRKPSETNPVPLKGKKLYTCRVCNMDISNHFYDGENIYKCCFCKFETYEHVKLQSHSYSHRPKNICDICEKEYIGDSHIKDHSCVVCTKKFQCRTMLKEHYLEHKDYFRGECWYCCDNIEYCNTPNENDIYVCCVCVFNTDNKRGLSKHKNVHRPKIFCKICRTEFDTDEMDLHGKAFPCFVCVKIFQCKTQLEDHLVDEHEKHLTTYCPFCKKELKRHRYERGKKGFECCVCFRLFTTRDFASHLLGHANLRILICDSCRRRFPNQDSLSRHNQMCTNMPYKCEICGVGFDNKSVLNLYRSKIHN